MAPTTLIGQKSTTSPSGRDARLCGYPMRVAEMLATHEGAYYIERVSVDSTRNILRAKKAIKKAFEYQIDNRGFTFIEVLSTCPTNWGMNPEESIEWLVENMMPVFPLGVFKDMGASQ